jgi:hypothetical protein
MHFAAGIPWLDGLVIPARPLRIGWVENEGPQEEFRRKLERKLEAWRDRVPRDHFHVLEVPWAELDLRRDDHRAGLAAAVDERDLDLLIIGPLNDLGMVGGGTPDEVRAFHDHLKSVQAQAGRLVSLMVLHHENTAGRVSGAWTGRPDLLVHVTAQGNGKTRVHWQKAKWSSSLHGTTNHLHWLDVEGFELAPEEAPRPERAWDGIAEYVLAHGGTAWTPVSKLVTGEADYLLRRRDQMLTDGVLLNAGTETRFKLWHRDDPARPPSLEESSGVRRLAEDEPSLSGVGRASGESSSLRYVSTEEEEDAPTPPTPKSSGGPKMSRDGAVKDGGKGTTNDG